jgi:transposase, IS5 family
LLLAESLRLAHAAGALRTRDLKRVTVDTTVQPKAISFPTDAKLLHAAIKGLNRLTDRCGRTAAVVVSAHCQARGDDGGTLCPCQAASIGNCACCAHGSAASSATSAARSQARRLEAAFQWPLVRAEQIRSQQQRQRGWKLYSFHAPEVECIGRGKAAAPYEFGVKASIVTTNARAPGGQFVLHAKAMPGNPYDGHTLAAVIDATEKLTGCAIERAYADKGYRGHDTANPRRVFIAGQKRGVFGIIKREKNVPSFSGAIRTIPET